jgi:hypothetical protein
MLFMFCYLGLIGILSTRFNGNVPNNPVVEARKNFAKFIGLALFKLGRECLFKLGPNCAVEGPCCFQHRVDGLREAHELFPSLFVPFDIELSKIDAGCDAFITSLLALYAEMKTQLVIGELIVFLEAERDKDSGELNWSHRLENSLETYFGSAMNFSYLRGKLQARAVQIRTILEQNPPERVPEVLRAKFSVELFESNLRNVLRSVYASFPPIQLESKWDSVRETEVKQKPTLATKKATPTAPVIEEESPFKGMRISGRFFRGVLEPVDERFAAIIEGRDINVKQYLLQRKRLARMNQKRPKTLEAKPTYPAASNLLQRHDSAEKIAWESQLPIGHDDTNENKAEMHKIDAKEESEEEEVVIHSRRPSSVVVRKENRGRRRFSEQETTNLIEGVRRFGHDWRRIQQNYDFQDRSNVDLKDKARNLEKLGLIK